MLAAALLTVVYATEAQVKLEVQSTTKVTSAETLVIASLKNVGNAPVKLITDRYFVIIRAHVYDPSGKEIEGRDARAFQGAKSPPAKVRMAELAPGQTLEIDSFSLVHATGAATADHLAWDLKRRAGQTVSLEFTYEVTPETASRAKELHAADFVTGAWKSKRVTVKVP